MSASTVHAFTTSQRPSGSKSLGYDFALLGLNVSEARVDIIREAASRTAARIQRIADQEALEADQMLSDLASSTYRLLDPRRRVKPRERIQLSILAEADFEQQRGSRTPLISFDLHERTTSATPLVRAELVSASSVEL